MRELVMTKAEAGQRLDRFLGKYMPGASSGFLHKMLRKKNIKLNNKKAEGNEKIKEEDKIQIFFSEETLQKFCKKKGKQEYSKATLTRKQEELRSQVRLLFASENILIFHKPAGMLTQKADSREDSLNDFLIQYCLEQGLVTEKTLETFRPSVANRLDRNTSGIVLCGITTAGLQALSMLLRERKLQKYYLCIVQGRMKKNQKIRGYLTKDCQRNTVKISSFPAKDAVLVETWYEVLRATSEASLVKVRLITGKSHQIRAHLASEGHPIFGDYKYGNRAWNDRCKRESGISSQMLHSYELLVPEEMETNLEELRGLHIVDEIPENFSRVLRQWHLEENKNGGKQWQHGHPEA